MPHWPGFRSVRNKCKNKKKHIYTFKLQAESPLSVFTEMSIVQKNDMIQEINHNIEVEGIHLIMKRKLNRSYKQSVKMALKCSCNLYLAFFCHGDYSDKDSLRLDPIKDVASQVATS